MKKIILTFIAMLLAGVNTALAQNVAKIGSTEYPTLAAAIEAVSDGGTITMIANVDGAPGMTVPSGKNFTVDFNGKTYTLNKPGAGSTNTETLGFQLLTGSTITFKNGTINISEENLTEAVAPAKNIKRIIQNYANLTLENMTIDGTNQFGTKELVVSLNNGTCAITGNTSITAGSTPVDPIMDVSQWSSYDGPVVTINTTGTIGGNIDINVQAIKSTSLTVENGNVQGTIVNSTSTFDVPVSVSGGTFEEALPENYLAAGFILSKNADGTYGAINEANAVAQIGDYGYETLAEAFAAVQDGDVIELLKNVTLTGNITFELESGKIYFKFNGKTVNKGNGNFHVRLPKANGNGARALAPSDAPDAGAIVYTDEITDIFAAAEGSTILTGPSDDPSYSYFYQAVADDDVNAIARNKQTGILFDDLQTAVDLAQAGQTIELLPAIEGVTIDKTVTIDKSITIEGGDYQVTSRVTTGNLYGPRLDPAFRITGPGSVTLNKVNLVAPYAVPGVKDGAGIYSQYPNGSIGILVDEAFGDSLVINYSTIATTSRGIDVQSIGGGFVLDVNHSTITSTADDPESVYINSFDSDPHGRGRGINFASDAQSCVANVKFSKIEGYAYPINVSENSGKVELNMTDCSTWGRNIINNWGVNSTFNLTNITANGYNNEQADESEEGQDNEAFAAVVDYKTASYNFYNIHDLKVVANVEADDASDTSASEKFIDLRGTDTTVKITGNSGYTIDDNLKDRVGFVNTNLDPENDLPEGSETDAFKRMIDKTVNNRIYFDDQAKAYFNYWFEILTPFDYDYDGDDEDEYIRIAIDDEKDHTNLYPVVPLEVNVMLTIKPETEDDEDEAEPKVFYYEKLQDAFNSEMFASGAEITILKNITMDEDITPDLKRGEEFTLTSLKREDGETSPYTINPAGFHIYLDPLVIANYDYDENPGDIFAASNEEITTILMRKTTDLVGIYQPTYDTEGHITGYVKVDDENVDRYVYTAANVYWAMDIDDVADYGQYWLFDELFTNDPEAPCAIWPNTYNRLEMDLKLERNLKFPTGDIFDGGFEEYDPNDPGTDEPIDEPDDEVTPQQFWIDFNGFTLDKNEEFSIILKVGQEVYTTATTDIFSSGDPEYTVVYDAVEEEKTIEDGETKVKFLYKYYLMKDGLAVIVDPSTYCGDRLTPNFIVKKKVTTEEADPNDDTQTITKETWVELQGISQEEYDAAVEGDEDVSGYDFVWHLVPPATDDADDKTYIDAKTYVQAIVIEGISFQGTRKADFTILPRDIKDVTASGNEQPWTEDGYAPMSDEEEGIVGIEDLIQLQYFCKNHGDAANPILQKYVEEIDEITGELLKSGDYIISVEDGPETDPAGYYKEIDTYSKVITITAVEGGNYTGTLKLDFTILPEDMIDISKCMVISDATYTSAPLPPTENRIAVIYKQTAMVADVPTEQELILPADAYTIEVHGSPDSYVDAKTYSNAITIVANPDVEVSGLRFYGTLDADYVIKQRDLADDSADPEENDNEGIVTLEAYAGEDAPETDPATIYLKWTGSELLPVINGPAPANADDPVTNNINLILNAKKDLAEGQTEADDVEWKLIPADYSYTIEPSPMIDPGIYKVIFTGRGNFTGMREVNVMVLKDIAELAEIEVPIQVIPNNEQLKPSEFQDVEVTDTDNGETLVEGVHYTMSVVDTDDDNIEYDDANPITDDDVYKVIITGKEPYYFNSKETSPVFVLFEYNTYDTSKNTDYNDSEYYNTHSSGYQVPDNPMSVRVIGGKDAHCLVGDNAYSNECAVDPDAEDFTIDNIVTFNYSDNSGAYAYQLKVTGIDDNAFRGNNGKLHWIDALNLTGYTPSTLTREATEDGPFSEYPVQSLVYLDGTQGGDVTGTNYVYKKGDDDFQCEELKIYDDLKGNQQEVRVNEGTYAWDFRNIYEFTADKVTNTRYFTGGQHYTICLPYKLQMPAGMKVYTLDAASDNIFGFIELSLSELDQFTPYLLIPSKGGNLLNNDESTVVYVTPTADQGQLNPKDTPTGHIMYGTNIYMDNDDAAGMYIMQSKNTWMKIDAGSSYNGACILPMRAYIQLPAGSGGSREFITSHFTDAIESLNAEVNDDWTNAEVYDLQGRKVDTTARLPKGVYIVNGQKRIRK